MGRLTGKCIDLACLLVLAVDKAAGLSSASVPTTSLVTSHQPSQITPFCIAVIFVTCRIIPIYPRPTRELCPDSDEVW